MGKFILTNKVDSISKLLLLSEEQGFRLNRSIDNNKVYSLWYHKKKVKIDNTFVCGEDYCCCSGGLIYNGKTGRDALENIYKDFSGDIAAIRCKIVGNYCITVKKSNKIYVFVDKYHIYQVYFL